MSSLSPKMLDQKYIHIERKVKDTLNVFPHLKSQESLWQKELRKAKV